VPNGWSNGSDKNASYRGTGNGTKNPGGYWAYGSSGDFSLGNLTSISAGAITHCVSFQNNTGTTLTAMVLSYDFEQYRYGDNTNGFTVSGTGALASSSLAALNQNGSSSGTDGTVTVTPKSISISGLNIAQGATFGICWSHSNGSGSDNGIAIDNFSLSSTLLPIQLSRFSASVAKNDTYLSWETASEINAEMFVLERSFEQQSFEDIARIVAHGSSDTPQTYSYRDVGLAKGIYLYRLRMTDLDGQFEYSALQHVAVNGGSSNPDVYPTLVHDQVHLNLTENDELVRILLFDSQGQILRSEEVSSKHILEVSDLQPGIYTLRIVDKSTSFVTYRFVKL
jgi:hypothetical protein